jgi:hypothetical protein
MKTTWLLVLSVILCGCMGEPAQVTTTTTRPKSTTTTTTLPAPDELSIAAWYVDGFGPQKAANPGLMAYYASRMDDHDIVVLQGISDEGDESFNKLCSLMKDHSCLISSRTGSGNEIHQYGVFYRNVVVEEILDANADYGVTEIRRPPYMIKFKTRDWRFRLTALHADPDNVDAELDVLDDLIELFEYGGPQIIIGNLYAECSSYETPPKHFLSWNWVIRDDEDTTAPPRHCAYDRIIVNPEAMQHFVDFNIMQDVIPEQSTHFLVSARFSTGKP